MNCLATPSPQKSSFTRAAVELQVYESCFSTELCLTCHKHIGDCVLCVNHHQDIDVALSLLNLHIIWSCGQTRHNRFIIVIFCALASCNPFHIIILVYCCSVNSNFIKECKDNSNNCQYSPAINCW